MSKLIWISTAVISLIISVIINFNSTSVSGFLTGSLSLGLIIFVASTLIVKLIQNIKQKNTGKAVLFCVLFSFFLFGYLIFSGVQDVSLPLVTPAHFRTNILTGQCDFGGYSGHVTSDPWYYKPGCDIPIKEKIEIFKKTRWYDQATEDCNMLCQRSIRLTYCLHGISSYVRDIPCKDLISCDKISCDHCDVRSCN